MNRSTPTEDNKMTTQQPSAAEMVAATRAAFATGKTRSVIFREIQLRNLKKMLIECEKQFHDALWKELHRNKYQAALFDLEIIINEIDATLQDIKKWTKPEKLPFNILMASDEAFIQKEPYGVVLVIGAWNALCLALGPLVGAIAAGNCCVVKPSELTPICSQLIADLLPKYLNKECFPVCQGGIPETTALLNEKFDYIFYTGSTMVGKIVATAAAKHLTPVTLELGGKCPVYIDDSADVQIAAKRIIGTKPTNHGQSCIGPDFIMCSKTVEEEFITACKKFLPEMFPEGNRQKNKDLSRIVNNHHFNRLKSLLDGTKGTIAIGGGMDEADNWIDITVVTDCQEDDSLMAGEIFGPILPIMTVNSPDEALKFINSRPKPLALYAFGKDDKVNMRFVNETSSGGVTINDLGMHAMIKGLPFGGVGDSGMGAYHGKYSYDTFTHKKAVAVRTLSPFSERMMSSRYPPYKEENMGTTVWFLKNLSSFNIDINWTSVFTHILLAVIAAVVVVLLYEYA